MQNQSTIAQGILGAYGRSAPGYHWPGEDTLSDWADWIEGARLLRKKDVKRPHSRDPHQLGPGWFFCSGAYVKVQQPDGSFEREWVVLYVRPHADLVRLIQRHCSQGELGSLQLQRPTPQAGFEDPVLGFGDRAFIASGKLARIRLGSLPAAVRVIYDAQLS